MQVNITARHLDLTPALADYVQKKLERVARHFRSVVRAQVVLDVEKHRHIAEIVVHANGHHDFRAMDVSADLYAAVDLVAEKLHKHMARQKDKRVRGRRGPSVRTVPLPMPMLSGPAGEDLAPAVTRVRSLEVPSMTTSQAIEELERNNHAFYIFLDEDVLNVVYRRKDKTYGILEIDPATLG